MTWPRRPWIVLAAAWAAILIAFFAALCIGCYVPKVEIHGHYHAATGAVETELVFGDDEVAE